MEPHSARVLAKSVASINARQVLRTKLHLVPVLIIMALWIAAAAWCVVHAAWQLLLLVLGSGGAFFGLGRSLFEMPLMVRRGLLATATDQISLRLSPHTLLVKTRQISVELPLEAISRGTLIFDDNFDQIRGFDDVIHLELPEIGTLLVPESAAGFSDLVRRLHEQGLLVRKPL